LVLPLRCFVLQVTQLSGLIELINGDLSKLDRKKLITLCTIDVHARDVLQRLIGKTDAGTAGIGNAW
jgi:dynein heavy chain